MADMGNIGALSAQRFMSIICTFRAPVCKSLQHRK